jgi:hypothetical protein
MPEGEGFLFGDQETPFQGIHLPPEVLEKIYFRNFERLVGDRPERLDHEAIVSECDRLLMMIGAMSAVQPDRPTDPSSVERVKAHFETLLQKH